MNKEQLIGALSNALGCDAAAAVDAVARWVAQQVVEQGALHVAGFGMFEVQKQMEYVWVDSSSRKRFLVPPRLCVRFVPDPLVPDEAKKGTAVFQQLAEVLVRQCQAQPHVAEQMPVAFFKLIMDGMETGEPVEVPGWGTFILTKVKVDGCIYGRVAFTPEEAFAAWVNRPFAYLPQVELSQGVKFDDITTTHVLGAAGETDDSQSFLIAKEEPAPTRHDNLDETHTQQESANATEPAPATEPESASAAGAKAASTAGAKPASAAGAKPVSVAELESASASGVKPAVGLVSESDVLSDDDSSEATEPAPQHRQWMWIALSAVAALLCIIVVAKWMGGSTADDGAPVVAQQVSTEGAASTDVAANTEGVANTEAAPSAVATADTIDYAAMNAQIPYGAYDIVGIDTIITVMPGQDLATISRIFLGTDIHIYLIVANHGNNHPQEGDKYRIPKLKLRK